MKCLRPPAGPGLQVLKGALHSTARSGRPEHASGRRSPLRNTQGAAVFENSTACAPNRPDTPGRVDVRPGSTLAPARPRGGLPGDRPEIKQYPVEAPGPAHVYGRPSCGATTDSFV